MAVDEEAVRTRLLASLNAAKRDRPWPRVLEVRDAVDELGRWLSDDRQWSAQTRGRHWQSLIDDVVASLDNLGVATSVELAVEDAKRELADCKGLFGGEKAPMDAALRRRLLLVVEGITSRAETADALAAAWADLERSALAGEEDEPAARQLLSLATWHGHEPDSLVSGLTKHLTGPAVIWAAGTLHVPDPENARSLEERLAAIRALVQTPPWRTVTIVWLRYQLARVDVPDAGLPTIEIGDAVRIFDGNWLRRCGSHPQNEHGLPPELLDESKWMLRSFCGVRAGDPPVIEQDPPESPTAYIRIVLEDEIVARAVDIARSNAEAIAAVGMLHGDAASEIWRLDDSHVAIAGDNEGGTSAPPSVEQPTASEREAVVKDTT